MTTDATRPTIALLIAQDHAYARSLCIGISAYARANGWRILSREIALGMPLEAYTGQINGIIGLSTDRDLPTLAKKYNAPLVCFGTPFPDSVPEFFILPDHNAIVRMGLEHLVSLGLRQVAFFGNKNNLSSGVRLKLFLELGKEYGLQISHFDQAFMDWSNTELWTKNKRQLAQWLMSLPLPCGILVTEDRCAAELSVTLESMDLNVPEDFSIISINDDQTTCEFCAIPVSSISLPTEEYGSRIAMILQDMMNGIPAPTVPIKMPPKGITVRRSSEMIHLGDSIIEKAVLRIRRDAPTHPLTVKELSQEFPLSKRAFVGRFTTVMGYPPKAEIDQVRTRQAKKLLEDPDLSVKEIAISMGFETTNVFSRFFRRVTDQSPTEYRQMCSATERPFPTREAIPGKE